jgi:DNA modification methylase
MNRWAAIRRRCKERLSSASNLSPPALPTSEVINGDCREALRRFPDNHFDAIVADGPYAIGFMGKDWDHGGLVFDSGFWSGEPMRVLKPGGNLVCFGSPRTHHLLMCAIEDAGFEIMDVLMWVHAQGFPKSHDVSKSVDRRLGATREIVGTHGPGSLGFMRMKVEQRAWEFAKFSDTPTTPEARRWRGYGTALKPAYEPIIWARRPLIGTVAENVLKWGVGALNIDGCRIPTTDELGGGSGYFPGAIYAQPGWKPEWVSDAAKKAKHLAMLRAKVAHAQRSGRWPANVLHDGVSQDWARYFYCAKASRLDRDEGLDKKNDHPCVKPTELMRWLCRLVKPPVGGLILDPFCGSGSTGKAAVLEGLDFVGIDTDQHYCEMAKARIKLALDQVLRNRTAR